MKKALKKTFEVVPHPEGEIIAMKKGKLTVPNKPIVTYITGDGIGQEITAQSLRAVDEAVAKAYKGTRKIFWTEIFAGDRAFELFGNRLPDETIAALKKYHVGIKGPLGTPSGSAGKGMRSLNVRIREALDTFACIRPVKWIPGVPSPVKRPQDLDIVIFRQNDEDLYAGIEFKARSKRAVELRRILTDWGYNLQTNVGLGIKPISKRGAERIVREAIQYAIDSNRKVVTLVAKSNIQKFTESAFLEWGMKLAAREFGDIIVTEDDLWSKHDGKLPEGKILINHRITDNMFAQLLVNPTKYSVLCTTNLNGDYLSDAAAAITGGLGQAPGTNKGWFAVVYEATHGTAPDIAGKNKANPGSMLLSLVMMLEDFGWHEAAILLHKSMEITIGNMTMTGDLARDVPGATVCSTTEYTDLLVHNMHLADKVA